MSCANCTGEGHSPHKTALTSSISHKFKVPRATLTSDQLAANSGVSTNYLQLPFNLLERLTQLRKHYISEDNFIIVKVTDLNWQRKRSIEKDLGGSRCEVSFCKDTVLSWNRCITTHMEYCHLGKLTRDLVCRVFIGVWLYIACMVNL